MDVIGSELTNLFAKVVFVFVCLKLGQFEQVESISPFLLEVERYGVAGHHLFKLPDKRLTIFDTFTLRLTVCSTETLTALAHTAKERTLKAEKCQSFQQAIRAGQFECVVRAAELTFVYDVVSALQVGGHRDEGSLETSKGHDSDLIGIRLPQFPDQINSCIRRIRKVKKNVGNDDDVLPLLFVSRVHSPSGCASTLAQKRLDQLFACFDELPVGDNWLPISGRNSKNIDAAAFNRRSRARDHFTGQPLVCKTQCLFFVFNEKDFRTLGDGLTNYGGRGLNDRARDIAANDGLNFLDYYGWSLPR